MDFKELHGTTFSEESIQFEKHTLLRLLTKVINQKIKKCYDPKKLKW